MTAAVLKTGMNMARSRNLTREDLTSGMNLGYTGKPYNRATGLCNYNYNYNYGYRDYKPDAVRFTRYRT
jgi:hypothetical protein